MITSTVKLVEPLADYVQQLLMDDAPSERTDQLSDFGLLGDQLRIRIGQSSDAEIKDLRQADAIDDGATTEAAASRRLFRQHEDVGRLQIAMNNALLMGVLQAVADAGDQFESLVDA